MSRVAERLVLLLGVSSALMPPVAAQARPPQLTLTRDLRIDATANNLSSIDAVTVSRDGTIILLQPQDHLIRYFSAAGKSLGTVGREGSGPEEFRRPVRAGWLGDTLWVYDGGQSRTMLISPERKVLRTIRRPSDIRASPRDTTPSGSVYSPLLGLYPDGSQLVMVILPMRTTSPRPPWSVSKLDTGSPSVVLRVTPDGVLQRIAAWAPDDACGYTIGTAYQFCGHPRADVSPDGSRIAFIAMSVAGADSGTFRVTAIGRCAAIRSSATARRRRLMCRSGARPGIRGSSRIAPNGNSASRATRDPGARAEDRTAACLCARETGRGRS